MRRMYLVFLLGKCKMALSRNKNLFISAKLFVYSVDKAEHVNNFVFMFTFRRHFLGLNWEFYWSTYILKRKEGFLGWKFRQNFLYQFIIEFTEVRTLDDMKSNQEKKEERINNSCTISRVFWEFQYIYITKEMPKDQIILFVIFEFHEYLNS